MCGIGGIWTRSDAPAAHMDLRRMMSAMAHRGPEGAAYGRLDGGSLLLGFLRLGFSADGLTQQPIYNEDGSVALVYNGEIYDHAALRRSLRRRGHRFRTASDSEVIVHLYEEYGERMFEHLNGEFSFVLFDSRRRELIAVRDRYGVKPLFYAEHEGAFVFASEAKGIGALRGFNTQLDPAYWTGPGVGVAECSMTPFRGIRSLRPGHLLRVHAGGTEERRWYVPRFGGSSHETVDEAATAVRDALTLSVRRRLEGDPPIALSLSSGLDSTILAGLMADELRQRGHRATAFSLGYDGAFYDESRTAARTAAHHGMKHERVSMSQHALAGGLLEGIWSVEVPTNSLSTTARLGMARAVRQAGFKALMSGEGADELFGGYPYFGIEAIFRLLDRDPARGRRALRSFRGEEALSRGMFWTDADPASVPDTFGFKSAYEQRVRKTDRAMRLMFSKGWLRGMGERTAWSTARGELDVNELRRLTPFDATRTISRSVLASLVIPSLGDRVEMASSLEGRAPYLDRDVISLACSLPERFCIDPGTQTRKHVLRRAFAHQLPAWLKSPPKHTRMAPTFHDLAQVPSGRAIIEAALDPRAVRRAGIFDPWFVRALRAAFRIMPAGGHRHAMLDMAVGYVVTTQLLHLVHVEDLLGKRGRVPSLGLEEVRSPQADAPLIHLGGAA